MTRSRNASRYHRLLPLVALLPLLLLMGAARAEDEAQATGTLSLSPIRAPAVAPGPVLSVPSDFQSLVEDPTDAGQIWSLLREGGGQWIQFENSFSGRFGAPTEAILELLNTIHGDVLERSEHHDIAQDGDRLLVAGRPAFVEAVGRSFGWALAGLVPLLQVEATFDATRPESRILATGGARLVPRRWTRVYLQQSDAPFCVDMDIELAQEATAMNPIMVNIPQGQELYVRYHPGEQRSLVELWVGEVRHEEVRTTDLSGVRNVPEGNAPSVLNYPVSQVARTHTVLVLDNGKPSKHVLQFEQEGRETRLTLAFGAPSAGHPPTEIQRPRPVAVLRMDAAAGSLDFDARAGGADMWIERMVSDLLARGFEDDDLQMQHISSAGCVFAEGLPKALAHVRNQIKAAEQRITTSQVQVRVVSLDAAAYQAAHRAGAARIGAPIARDLLSTWERGPVTVAMRLTLPLVHSIPAGFRLGHSEPGLFDFEVEVAQKSAGMDPQTTAYFRGLAGVIELDRSGAGHVLHLEGALSSADAEAGSLTLTFRTPVGMDVQHAGLKQEPGATRAVVLPVIGSSSSPIDASVPIAAGDVGRPHLIAVVIRGSEVQLVLATIL